MATAASTTDEVRAGESASIENVHSAAISISLDGDDGLKLTFDLAPQQVLSFKAGNANVQIILHHGDPDALRVIKQETAT